MDNQNILDELASGDWARITEMLSRVGAEKEVVPSPDVFRRIIELISDSDPDVRRLAIFAVGLHWQYLPALPSLIKVLHDVEEDSLVLSSAIGSLGTIAHGDESVRNEVLHELATLVKNESMPGDVRTDAYTSVLWAAHRIAPKEYGRRPLEADLSDIDWQWLATL
jgi:hypothetical protein